MVFFDNNLEWSAATSSSCIVVVADRIFFKHIKQRSQLADFLGTSATAVISRSVTLTFFCHHSRPCARFVDATLCICCCGYWLSLPFRRSYSIDPESRLLTLMRRASSPSQLIISLNTHLHLAHSTSTSIAGLALSATCPTRSSPPRYQYLPINN